MLPIHSNSCVKSWKAKNNKSEKNYPLYINKYNWEGIDFSSETDDWKKFEKIIQQFLLMFYVLKKKKIILLMFQNITHSVRKKLFFEWFQTEKTGIILQYKNYQHY